MYKDSNITLKLWAFTAFVPAPLIMLLNEPLAKLLTIDFLLVMIIMVIAISVVFFPALLINISVVRSRLLPTLFRDSVIRYGLLAFNLSYIAINFYVLHLLFNWYVYHALQWATGCAITMLAGFYFNRNHELLHHK